MADERRSGREAGKKTGNLASRRQVAGQGERVISGGRSYQRSMVGDRLEARGARSPRAGNVTPADYADYMSGFAASRGHSDGSGRAKKSAPRGLSRWSGKSGKAVRSRKAGFDNMPPGNPIKDVAAKYLPKMRVRIIASLVSAIFFGMLTYQIYMSLYVDYTTEKVTISPYLETIDVEGIAIRDELIIDGTLSKNSVKAVRNGERVSKGEPIVNIYSSVSEAAAYERVSEIDAEIEKLKSIVSMPDDTAGTVTKIGKQLDKKMVSLNEAANRRDVSAAAALRDEIVYLMNKRLIAMHQVENYNSRIEQLEAEKEELQQKYSKNPKTITAPDSGYFSDTCDGYESLLSSSIVDDLTVDKLDEIMNKEVTPPEKTIGKLVSSFSWSLACPVSAIDSDFLVQGYTYTIYLPYSETESIQAVLKRIDKQEGQDKFLAIFSCSSLASELRDVRRQPVKIVKCCYEGFAIQKSALHAGVKDVEHKNEPPDDVFPRGHLKYITKTTYPSVYAIVAGQIKEKEVSIIYGTDDMVICLPKNGDDYLSVGDTVVIAERGLYNGKILN